MIPLLVLALLPGVINIWPPRAPIEVCLKSCAWDSLGTRCRQAETIPGGCRGIAWAHRWGPGNTLGGVSICYRSGRQQWCENYFPPIGEAGPIVLVLAPPLPPDDGLIFSDGFESGDTTKWSNP